MKESLVARPADWMRIMERGSLFKSPYTEHFELEVCMLYTVRDRHERGHE